MHVILKLQKTFAQMHSPQKPPPDNRMKKPHIIIHIGCIHRWKKSYNLQEHTHTHTTPHHTTPHLTTLHAYTHTHTHTHTHAHIALPGDWTQGLWIRIPKLTTELCPLYTCTELTPLCTVFTAGCGKKSMLMFPKTLLFAWLLWELL